MSERKPSGSVSVYFGVQLRKRRKELGLTQEKLGEKLGYANTMVTSIETGKRPPSRQFVEGVEREIGGDGSFLDLWPAINEEKYPPWFQNYAELEARAISIQDFEAQLIPGLLQTEAYARAVFDQWWPPQTPEEVEQKVSARLDRREILQKPDAPYLWVLLDEAVLRRPAGSAAVMREQCEYLIEASTQPCIKVQVLPFSCGLHAAHYGAFTLLEDKKRTRYVHIDQMGGAASTTDPGEITVYTQRMNALHAAALSLTDSRHFLSHVIGDYS